MYICDERASARASASTTHLYNEQDRFCDYKISVRVAHVFVMMAWCTRCFQYVTIEYVPVHNAITSDSMRKKEKSPTDRKLNVLLLSISLSLVKCCVSDDCVLMHEHVGLDNDLFCEIPSLFSEQQCPFANCNAQRFFWTKFHWCERVRSCALVCAHAI